MKLGFSGTQLGMTTAQQLRFALLLVKLQPTEFHHGDCVGADVEAHAIVRKFPRKVKIVVHPPCDPRKRARCVGDVILPTEEYLVRNHAIVDATDLLVITPKTKTEELRSGTWSTWRYAKKLRKKTRIIAP